MSWNKNLNTRRLYFSKVPGTGGKYRLEQFQDIVTNEGQVYREPIPTDSRGLRTLEFDEIILLGDHPPIKRDSGAGMVHLINTNNAGYDYARS